MKNNKELIIAIAVFILFIFVSVFVLGFKQPFNTQLPPDQSTTQLSPKPSETPLGTAIKNSDKISQNDFKIRSELISKTSGGYIYLSKNFHIVYLENEGIFQVRILTSDLDATKLEATKWFYSQGVSVKGICTLPVIFYVPPRMIEQLQKDGRDFNPLPEGC